MTLFKETIEEMKTEKFRIASLMSFSLLFSILYSLAYIFSLYFSFVQSSGLVLITILLYTLLIAFVYNGG